jgi:hypothetical protein
MDVEKAIGESNKNEDYILDLEKHIVRYQDSLPQLTALLKDSEVQYVGGEYTLFDEKANGVQKKYKDYSKYARRFGFWATVFTVLVTISGSLNELTDDLLTEESIKIIVKVSAGLAIAFGAVAGAFVTLIKRKGLLNKWMEFRSEAEERRTEYFNLLAQNVSGKSISEHLQVLEYFRRYQLDVQLNFYTSKSETLEGAANKSLKIIIALGATVVILNGIIGLGLDPKYSILASLALIVQAYSFMTSNKELTNQNERNAERYARSRSLMAGLKAKIDPVKMALESKDFSALTAYFNAVHEPLLAEHQQWLKTMKASSVATTELEKHIAGTQEKTKPSED